MRRERIFRRFVEGLETEDDCAILRRLVGERLQVIQQAAARERRAKRGPGQPRRTLTAEEREAVVRALANGTSIRAIARKIDVPHATLTRIVAREKLLEAAAEPPRPKPGGAWQRRKRRAEIRRSTGINLDAIERRAKYRAELEEKLRASIAWRSRLEADLELLDREDEDALRRAGNVIALDGYRRKK